VWVRGSCEEGEGRGLGGGRGKNGGRMGVGEGIFEVLGLADWRMAVLGGGCIRRIMGNRSAVSSFIWQRCFGL